MRLFENKKVGDWVYLPNDPKGYPITQCGVNCEMSGKFNEIQVRFGNIQTWFDLDGRVCQQKWHGQIIYLHPVTIQDGRSCDNCEHDKQCDFQEIPSRCMNLNKHWQPREEKCK